MRVAGCGIRWAEGWGLAVAQTFLSAGSGDFPVASGHEHGTGMFRELAGWKARATDANPDLRLFKVRFFLHDAGRGFQDWLLKPATYQVPTRVVRCANRGRGYSWLFVVIRAKKNPPGAGNEQEETEKTEGHRLKAELHTGEAREDSRPTGIPTGSDCFKIF